MVGAAAMNPADEPPGGEPERLALGTLCACGHERRDHRGLQMEARGPCLECRCDEFIAAARAPVPPAWEMERIRAAFEQLEGLRAAMTRLQAP
jgi:hypothetical protein